jgi:hypothetical protein
MVCELADLPAEPRALPSAVRTRMRRNRTSPGTSRTLSPAAVGWRGHRRSTPCTPADPPPAAVRDRADDQPSAGYTRDQGSRAVGTVPPTHGQSLGVADHVIVPLEHRPRSRIRPQSCWLNAATGCRARSSLGQPARSSSPRSSNSPASLRRSAPYSDGGQLGPVPPRGRQKRGGPHKPPRLVPYSNARYGRAIRPRCRAPR